MLLAACGTEPPPAPEPQAPATTEPRPTAAELAVVPEGTDPIQLELIWHGIGPLYKGFFTEQGPLTELSRRLAPHVVPPAQLHISWDQEQMLGGIRLEVPPGGFRAEPTVSDGVLAVAGLTPITVALAAYRDAISGRFDIRIQSFVVGLDRTKGPAQCRIGIAGTPPPDGADLDPCLTLNGQEHCGAEASGGLRFTGDALKVLGRCFD